MIATTRTLRPQSTPTLRLVDTYLPADTAPIVPMLLLAFNPDSIPAYLDEVPNSERQQGEALAELIIRETTAVGGDDVDMMERLCDIYPDDQLTPAGFVAMERIIKHCTWHYVPRRPEHLS